MATTLLAGSCSCTRPAPLAHRRVSGFVTLLPSVQTLRSNPAVRIGVHETGMPCCKPVLATLSVGDCSPLNDTTLHV